MSTGWKGWLTRKLRSDDARGFLTRLRGDVRGNTLALAGAVMIPLAGMVGGGIDMSRMYLTKTRLQHACDAGALAGRKSMGGGAWETADDTVAKRFFDANYMTGAYGSTGLSRSFSENSGTVTGIASATLPMTLMRVLGKTTETLAVTCQAAMRLPNTDVMFVLDTTGSMNCVAGDATCTNNGEVPAPGSKIDGLKEAVKCFYEIVANEDTTANCSTGTPSGGLSGATQVRFGFMPYASNVNVGYLLPTSYFANSWRYQTRVKTGAVVWGDWELYSYHTRPTSGTNKNKCVAPDTDTTERQYKSEDYRQNGTDYCLNYRRDRIQQWKYDQISTNVSGLKNGTNWRTSLTMAIENDGSNRSVPWSGCIEERPTKVTTNYSPIPSDAYDLNIDLVPSQSNANSLWGFALPKAVFLRDVTTSWSQLDRAAVTTTDLYYNSLKDNCPTQAVKLKEWDSATDFSNYVDSLEGRGNTYHDIGMLWGARFMSPTGIFASENATTPGGGEILRHMIFMTDGDSSSSPCDYNAYGVPWFDQRQSTDVGTASNCNTNRQALIDQIDLRLAALCTAVKNKNITLWVVSYGGGLDAATETRLETCASTGKYFQATSSANLQSTFKTIANQISQLRLTR